LPRCTRRSLRGLPFSSRYERARRWYLCPPDVYVSTWYLPTIRCQLLLKRLSRGWLVLPSFLARFREVADVVFVVHGSTTDRQASAWYTTDDNSRPTVSFTYGGVVRQHGRFASFPGSCTLPVTVPCRLSQAMAPLHEFCHAASDFNNGKVNDLYKARAKPPTSKLALPIIREIRSLPAGPHPKAGRGYGGV
jgi:hypothetical protein